MSRPRTTCIFCRQPGASEEHVFSKSLAKLVPGDGGFTIRSDDSAPRKSKVLDVTNKATCVACNTGWMSDFEGRALPLLKDPIQGRERSFSVTEQIELAAWAFKTACMLDCSWPGRVIPDSHFRYLFRFRIPPRNTHIWITSYRAVEGEDFHSVQGIRAGRDVTSPRLPRPNRAFSYRVAMSVGHLVFYLFGYVGADEQDYDPILTLRTKLTGKVDKLGDFFHPLWPIYELNLSWPPLIGFGGTALSAFMRGMSGRRIQG